MKAVVYREYAPDDDYSKILKVENIDVPKPKADEVIFTNDDHSGAGMSSFFKISDSLLTKISDGTS